MLSDFLTEFAKQTRMLISRARIKLRFQEQLHL